MKYVIGVAIITTVVVVLIRMAVALINLEKDNKP